MCAPCSCVQSLVVASLAFFGNTLHTHHGQAISGRAGVASAFNRSETVRTITRRSALAGAAASTALLGRRASAADDLAGTTLRVATYGGGWRDSIVKFVLPD